MIQEIPYAGWPHNVRLAGKTTELVITLDIGPRVMRYSFHNSPNVFAEIKEQLGVSGEKDWVVRGGHRLWTAPEAPHSYEADNSPVSYRKLGENALEVIQPVGPFGFQKSMKIELLEDEMVRVTHILANPGSKPLPYTPWALSVMAPGGTALIPQPRLDLHPSEFPEGREVLPQDFLPNREIHFWAYTNLFDGRYSVSEHFLRVSQNTEKPPTKIGLKFDTGWVAYQNGDLVFAKHFVRDPNPSIRYPDCDSNFEVFTNHEILELETLAPHLPLEPGTTREHVEHWVLRRTSEDLRQDKAASEFFATLPAIK